MKTVKFYTLGCKVNQYDTQNIRERFQESGFKEALNKKRVDVCVINTCTVTQRADSESLNLIRRARRENPQAVIVATGCLVQLDAKIIKSSGADLIVKNREKNNIPKILLEGKNKGKVLPQGISDFAGHSRAFIKVQDGCNNFCSFCKVPLVRGRSESRKPQEIIDDTLRLAKRGYQEIVLTGICLGSYGEDFLPKTNLVKLIKELEDIEGIKRIRLSSIEAFQVSDELIALIKDSPKMCKHLHIPLQSGDPEILKKMNRPYTSAQFLNLIAKVKKRIPGIAITTDCLVGFPGETQNQFMNSVKMIKKIQPLKVHVFPYSKRPGTLASCLKEKPITSLELKQRSAYLRNIASGCSLKYRRLFLNKVKEVLIESRHTKNIGTWHGFSDNYIPVELNSKRSLVKKIVRVKLTGLTQEGMLGKLLD